MDSQNFNNNQNENNQENNQQDNISKTQKDYGYASTDYHADANAAKSRKAQNSFKNETGSDAVKKRKRGGKAVIAAALVAAILGGVGGGSLVAYNLNEGTESSSVDSTETTTQSAISSKVVNVTTNSSTTTMTPQTVYDTYANAVVAIANESTTTNVFGQESETASSGSGFIISSDGYILTNNHVVADAQTLTVTTTDGKEYNAEIVGADEENDVALIKIDGTDLPTVSIGDSDSIEVGEQVCAIGNPLGELTDTLTVGYVSALDREIDEDGTPINMFQTDCAINAGNSGGPIFDMNGNVIGITTAKYSASALSGEASVEGIGFCIPINDAMDIANDLLTYGYVTGRPSLGISCSNIPSTITEYYNLPDGVYVESVTDGGAAYEAGIKDGDIITAIDGTEISTITELKASLKEHTAGDQVTLTVYRSSDASTQEIPVTLDEKTTETQTQDTQSEGDNTADNYDAGVFSQEWNIS